MFFDSNKNNQHELEIKYSKLNDMYKEKEKQQKEGEREIEQLSKKLRSWIRKYHKLELSFVEDDEPADSGELDELKQLQALVLKLNKRNKKLEAQLADQEGTNNPRDTVVDAGWDESQSIRIDLGLDDQTTEPERAEESEEMSAISNESDIEIDDEDAVVLEFSPTFQAILEKHAEECG